MMTDDDRAAFVARIDALAEKLGLTRTQFLVRSGVSRAFARDLLDGKSQSPRRDKVRQIAKFAGVSEEWLLDGRDGYDANVNAVVFPRDRLKVFMVNDFRAGFPMDDPGAETAPFLLPETMAKGAVALRVDESLSSAQFPGGTYLALRSAQQRPPRRGDIVLAFAGDQPLIGRLVTQGASWGLEALSGEQRSAFTPLRPADNAKGPRIAIRAVVLAAQILLSDDAELPADLLGNDGD